MRPASHVLARGLVVEVLAEVGEPPPHDPLAKPDRRGDLAALGHSPNRASIDTEEFRHLADADNRDIGHSIPDLIHE
jgi:hypothetical protein